VSGTGIKKISHQKIYPVKNLSQIIPKAEMAFQPLKLKRHLSEKMASLFQDTVPIKDNGSQTADSSCIIFGGLALTSGMKSISR